MVYEDSSKRSYGDAFELVAGHDDYPSPPETDDSSLSIKDEEEQAPLVDQPQKKKRRQWGQHVPDIVPVLPPRKRAKTAEEKEQRKNERILRNRRAADKSRQRQKAAQADLENENVTLKVRVAHMEKLLLQYGIPQSALVPPTPAFSVITQPDHIDDEIDLGTPAPSMVPSEANTLVNHDLQPSISQLSFDQSDTSQSLFKDEHSPTLAPQLNVNNVAAQVGSTNQVSDLTQYPAAILCDPQCQSEALTSSSLRFLQPNHLISTLLTTLHYLTTILSSPPSTSTPLPISQLFQTLEQILAMTSTSLESALQTNFHLIHILISMPSTSTQPAVFRLKLLSWLLACNPSLAPLLMMAADRALQERLALGDCWTVDPAARWAVASLMTIKWSIEWLNKQHVEVRDKLRKNTLSEEYKALKIGMGIEVDAVLKYCVRFEESDGEESVSVPRSTITTNVDSTIVDSMTDGLDRDIKMGLLDYPKVY